MKNMNFKLESKEINKISDYINLNRNIAIYGDVGTGKTTLLNKVIQEMAEKDNERKVFIIPEKKSEFKEVVLKNKNVKAFINIEEATATLKNLYEIWNIKERNTTIVIDNIEKNNDEKLNKLIEIILKVGRGKGINVIATTLKQIDRSIESNFQLKFNLNIKPIEKGTERNIEMI